MNLLVNCFVKRAEILEKIDDNKYLYKEGEVIFQEGDCDNDLMVLESGELGIFKGEQLIARTSVRGEILGEIRGILNTPRTATVKAFSDCVLHVVYRYMGGDLSNELVTYRPDIAKQIVFQLCRRIIDRSQDYSNLRKSLLYLFQVEVFSPESGNFKTIYYKEGETIVQEGAVTKEILILQSGIVGIYQKDQLIARLYGHVTVGDISKILGRPGSITIKALTDTDVHVLSVGDDNSNMAEELITTYPVVSKKLMFHLAQRLYQLD